MNLGCHGLSYSLPVPCWDDTNMQATYRKKLHHINLPGHSHELTFSCYRRLPLLTQERPCRWMIDAIEAARVKYNYHLFAFVIMPEHVHIIVRPQETKHDIAGVMKISKKRSKKCHKNVPVFKSLCPL